ncbi:hypothetical protein JYP51_22455 [Ponticoccus gilvus]|nr:hypothetical protein [Enemella evansiae]
MANARNYLAIVGENVFIFENGHGTGVHYSELLGLMAESRSLAEVKKKFRASRDLLLNFHPAATGAQLVFTPIGAG